MSNTHITYGTNFFTELHKRPIKKQLEIAERRFGVLTNIFYPVKSLNVYGNEDVNYQYATTPDEINRRCFIPNLLKDMTRSIELIDPYFQDSIFWYDPLVKRLYDQGTLLVIKLGVRTDSLVMRVDTYHQAPGGTDPVYIRYSLIPAV